MAAINFVHSVLIPASVGSHLTGGASVCLHVYLVGGHVVCYACTSGNMYSREYTGHLQAIDLHSSH